MNNVFPVSNYPLLAKLSFNLHKEIKIPPPVKPALLRKKVRTSRAIPNKSVTRLHDLHL